MAKSDVGLTAVSVLAEILSATSLPGSSVLQRAADKMLDDRKKAAIEALTAAIATVGPENVSFGEEDADEFVQMLLRFWKASVEGVARQNLNFLALVIMGLKKNKTFHFDEFQECANVLENLTRDEIIFVGRMYRYMNENPDKNRVLEFLNQFDDEGERKRYKIIAASLQRTGMLVPISVFSDTDYIATSILMKVCGLARMGSVN